jgi:LCP family protein required for cell wall assembly
VRRAVFIAFVLGVLWLIVAFLSFRQAVHARNEALPKDVRAALAPTNGPAIASSQVTMLVGADTSTHRKRTEGANYGLADSLMLMRVDIPSRTVSMLSIPRDLYVEVPRYGHEKINTAYANGGLALSISTVRQATGIDVNHVAQIDFDGFKEVVDDLGGIEIDNPTQIESGAEGFDGHHWRFRKGKQTLNGRNALAYARLRKVDDATLARDPAEGVDTGRARRQQRVVDAIVQKVVSLDSIRHPNGVPKSVVKPLLTDISASQMIAFGFGKWWAKSDNSLRCRLGGDDQIVDGQDVIVPDESNRAAVRMFMGKQAPVPPENAYGAGCVRLSN